MLSELGAIGKETILVLNKVDMASEEQLDELREKSLYKDIIEVSAKEGTNLEELLYLIEEKLPYSLIKAEFMIPYHKGDVVSFLHRNGRVFEEDYKDEGTLREKSLYKDIIEVSAKEGTNLEELLYLIEEKLPYSLIKAEFMIPYHKGDVVSFLHRNGRVFEEDYKDEGTYMMVEVDEEVYNKTEEYVTKVIE